MTGLRAHMAMLALMLAASPVAAEEWAVQPRTIADAKAVFATVESANVVPARARIGGSVLALTVKRGDAVQAGQVIATVTDDKIALQIRSLDAQIEGLRAQLAQANTDFNRIQPLAASGAASKAQLDATRTAVNVASTALNARIAERSVIVQQQNEGGVRAPTAGRVLEVPVTVGTVVMPGETILTIAERDFVLRLRLPERHARFLKVGDPVRLDGSDLAGGQTGTAGTITLVYPQIDDGRVVADAKVPGLGDYFVGQRVRVWVSGGERSVLAVPDRFLITRHGMDYARLRSAGSVIDAPIQRGQALSNSDVEILSGLAAGDVLVSP